MICPFLNSLLSIDHATCHINLGRSLYFHAMLCTPNRRPYKAGLARLLICRCVCSLPDCWLSKQGVVRQDGSLGIHLGSLWVFIYLYWTVIEERQEKEEQSALYRKNMLHWPLPASSTSENSIKDYFTFISMLLRAEMNWLFEEATEFSYKLIEPLSLLEAKDKLRDTHCGLSLYAFF